MHLWSDWNQTYKVVWEWVVFSVNGVWSDATTRNFKKLGCHYILPNATSHGLSLSPRISIGDQMPLSELFPFGSLASASLPVQKLSQFRYLHRSSIIGMPQSIGLEDGQFHRCNEFHLRCQCVMPFGGRDIHL